MSMKEYAIDTFDLAEWNVLRAIMRLGPRDLEYRITPNLNPIRWLLGHMALHMDFIFNHLCQGKKRLGPNVWRYFATGAIVTEKDEFPFSYRDMIDAFLELFETSIAYLRELPEEKFNRLPERNEEGNTETVRELLQRITLHFLGHTGQIYLVKKELGKGGYFVTGVHRKGREESRKKWLKWWSRAKKDYV